MTKQTILEALKRLDTAKSEIERDAVVVGLKETAPHARLSDLVYYGERDRTYEEIAEEALLRERIWAEGGELALNAHIERQLLAALANPAVPSSHYTKVSARMLLESMRNTPPH